MLQKNFQRSQPPVSNYRYKSGRHRKKRRTAAKTIKAPKILIEQRREIFLSSRAPAMAPATPPGRKNPRLPVQRRLPTGRARNDQAHGRIMEMEVAWASGLQPALFEKGDRHHSSPEPNRPLSSPEQPPARTAFHRALLPLDFRPGLSLFVCAPPWDVHRLSADFTFTVRIVFPGRTDLSRQNRQNALKKPLPLSGRWV